MINDEQTPFIEIDHSPDVLDIVSQRLISQLHNSTLVEEIKSSLPTARGLIDKLKLDSNSLSVDSPQSIERAVLLIALANRWRTVADNNYTELKRLARILALIYPRGIRERKIPGVEVFQAFGMYPGSLGLILARAFPQCWQVLHDGEISSADAEKMYLSKTTEERERDSNKMLMWAKEHLAQNGLIFLPYNHLAEGLVAIEDAYRVLNVPKTNRIQFKGVACPNLGLMVFLQKNPAKSLVAHERNHVLYPGLGLYELGGAINEGMTEYLALEEINPRRGKFREMMSVALGAYGRERLLLKKIKQLSPDAFSLLVSRYKSGKTEDAFNLAVQLIETFGLESYLNLYLASPTSYSESTAGNGFVVIQTKIVLKNLSPL